MDSEYKRPTEAGADESKPAPSYQPPADKPKKSGGKAKMFIMALIFLVLGAAGGYYYADMQAQKELDQAKQEASDLATEKAKLAKDLADAKKANEKTTVAVSKEVTQEQLDNIIDAVGSGNYAAVQSYFANPVKIIIAASEGLGNRTPVQAVTDLKYLDSAKDPWDFDLAKAVIDEYKKGDYKEYFPANALVGKSTDGRVVVFGFNDEAKINLVFMAADADSL